MTKPAYPGRDTAKSYNGREVLCECPECGHRAYIPPLDTFGSEGYCTRCESIVEWREW